MPELWSNFHCPTKIVYAGGTIDATYIRQGLKKHNDYYYKVMERQPYWLLSFFYFERYPDIVDYAKEKPLFLLDSGAFSAMNGKGDLSDDYVKKYCRFVRQHNIKHYIELDLDYLRGVKETRQLRNRIEEEVGWASVPVWHKVRGLEDWESDCKKYDYVAMGGIAINGAAKARKDAPYFAKMIAKASNYNTKVHLLGCTDLRVLQRCQPYSADTCTINKVIWNGYRFKGKKYASPKDARAALLMWEAERGYN